MKQLTTEEFIAKAKAINGADKYDYSQVEYKNTNTKVAIICSHHGLFEQTPHNHLRNHGCPKCAYELCANKFRKDSQEFINFSNHVHGGKYTYDKVVYVDNKTKVIITCPIHGDFRQIPSGHMSGQGCGKCAGNAVLSTQDFIFRSKNLFGDSTYDYSKTKYKHSNQKVTITCRTHGDFQQVPCSHLGGHGCNKCAIEFRAAFLSSSTQEFISKSKNLFGDGTYDYSKTKYINSNQKVTITCRTHGDFQQMPSTHLSGHGCARCGGNARSSTQEFIFKSQMKHGSDLYDYSKVEYKNDSTKVIITCNKHGDFEQRPNSHLRGRGCPKCKSSTGETIIRTWLKAHQYQFEEQVRFASCKNINQLPFDFVVNATNQILIEFHGQQHYEPFSFRSRKESIEQMEANLARVQHNDAIKAKWCADNNIPLLVIPYWDQHRIPELLEEFLGKASLAAV